MTDLGTVAKGAAVEAPRQRAGGHEVAHTMALKALQSLKANGAVCPHVPRRAARETDGISMILFQRGIISQALPLR